MKSRKSKQNAERRKRIRAEFLLNQETAKKEPTIEMISNTANYRRKKLFGKMTRESRSAWNEIYNK